ncbi:hypothetical protein CC85DRAFT_283160 [Cutaneotrichosporon oleaginosum]|uniref:Uncharacterized protein n=1 Tax=Cutaneotrichosporon oleaginosum TaxID=879819 RepID=A0A0J0XUV1_9TREE|nr:uncharacterized protein CC85DRAFT_283160 [Cutaneotrichosporon oleaginosum]KLT44858.1 hypothetical protein CC85DRAFT_283160 [Cutaneotrichosporon oleaginosum]TXT11993.1 hypothetical protein COLE_02403 [Cutaneotrichosporon oleaginosum]
MAPAQHAGSGVERRELTEEGEKGLKVVVPAVIGAIFGIAFVAVVIIGVIVRVRMKRREKKFWKQAEARNSIRQSRMMALSEQGSIATRDSYATLDSLASGVSGPQIYNSALLPSFPSERSLRASMMSSHSSYSSPYDSSPLARSATASRIDDPWDARSDADPGEAVPMLATNRSPRPSLIIDTGSSKPPAYNKTYTSSSQYPQVIVSEPSEIHNAPEPPAKPAKQGQYSAAPPNSEAARAGAIAAAAAQLEGHDYEYTQAVANAAAAAAAEQGMSTGHASKQSTHEIVRNDGGLVRPSTIVQVEPAALPVRQKSLSAEVEGKAQ